MHIRAVPSAVGGRVVPRTFIVLVPSILLDEWQLILVEAIWAQLVADSSDRKSTTRGDNIRQSTLMQGLHVVRTWRNEEQM